MDTPIESSIGAALSTGRSQRCNYVPVLHVVFTLDDNGSLSSVDLMSVFCIHDKFRGVYGELNAIRSPCRFNPAAHIPYVSEHQKNGHALNVINRPSQIRYGDQFVNIFSIQMDRRELRPEEDDAARIEKGSFSPAVKIAGLNGTFNGSLLGYL